MTLRFFEGAAGTGKTHNIIEEARSLVAQNILGEHGRILALTFMNGARRRLLFRLGQHREFRRSYECQTFDVFARRLVVRRQSVLRRRDELRAQAEPLGEFDGPCCLAAGLLDDQGIRRWVAASYPLVLVDEAQDLDVHRSGILRPLTESAHAIAGADEFQCLYDGRDTRELMEWLAGTGETTRLTDPMRTDQAGLLAAANAIRNGQDVRAILRQSDRAQNPTWYANGFRLVEAPAANAGIVGWNIANQMRNCQGPIAILTPDSRNQLLLDALTMVNERAWGKDGNTFGPFRFEWEDRDEDTARNLADRIDFPDQTDYDECIDVLRPHEEHAAVAAVMGRVRRRRRAFGQLEFRREHITALIEDAVRNQARHSARSRRGNVAMTIQRAKNREFPNVIVLWPHSATGSNEHRRRLLYNAVTRATGHCSVVVVGQGLCNRPPFVPEGA